MTIRALLAQDLPYYRSLMLEAYEREPQAFTSTVQERSWMPQEWWLARIADPQGQGCAFGAFVAGRLVGAVALEFEGKERTRHKALLVGMYLKPGVRGQGLGRGLVNAALAEARSRPATRLVQLTFTEGNLAAQALYTACGFVPFGVEPLAICDAGVYRAKVHMWCDLRAEGVSRAPCAG